VRSSISGRRIGEIGKIIGEKENINSSEKRRISKNQWHGRKSEHGERQSGVSA